MNLMVTQEIGFFFHPQQPCESRPSIVCFSVFAKDRHGQEKPKKILFGFLKAVRFHLFALTQIPRCAKLTDR